MFVKVCGLRTKEEVNAAVEMGYNAFGMILTEKSRRSISKRDAIALHQIGKGNINSVAVALNYSEIEDVAHIFDYIQLYEYHNLDNLIYASDTPPDEVIKASIFIYDSSRGSGEFQPPPRWVKSLNKKVILAGGLNPENVRKIINEFTPFGVDVSSGVERNGRKDVNLMKKFIQEVKTC